MLDYYTFQQCTDKNDWAFNASHLNAPNIVEVRLPVIPFIPRIEGIPVEVSKALEYYDIAINHLRWIRFKPDLKCILEDNTLYKYPSRISKCRYVVSDELMQRHRFVAYRDKVTYKHNKRRGWTYTLIVDDKVIFSHTYVYDKTTTEKTRKALLKPSWHYQQNGWMRKVDTDAIADSLNTPTVKEHERIFVKQLKELAKYHLQDRHYQEMCMIVSYCNWHLAK